MKTESELFAEARVVASRAMAGSTLALRHNGTTLAAGSTEIDELLARAVRREAVELELDIVAYEQEPGKRNRNAVRFKDGKMIALGRTGRGRPYMRDHKQGDVTARGGTVIASSTTKVSEGHYKVMQTVRLTEPSAVERALRGLMDTVSIGWNPTGPIECSACGKPVLVRGWCWHWPGDEIALNGGTEVSVIEWIYTDAELLETSEVSVPGVPTAGIEGIRAALSAALNRGGMAPPQENDQMKNLPAYVALLGLAATAGEDDILPAVEALKKQRDALQASNTELGKLQVRLAAEQEVARAAIAAQELSDFIAGGVAEGKLVPGSAMETSLRAYHASDKGGAVALLASMPRIVPVGQPSQAAKPAPMPAGGAGNDKLEAAAQRIAEHSPAASLDGVRATMLALGKSPAEADRIIAAQLAPKGN